LFDFPLLKRGIEGDLGQKGDRSIIHFTLSSEKGGRGGMLNSNFPNVVNMSMPSNKIFDIILTL